MSSIPVEVEAARNQLRINKMIEIMVVLYDYTVHIATLLILVLFSLAYCSLYSLLHSGSERSFQ